MGKDKRLWRKLVKKLCRKRKRQLQAEKEVDTINLIDIPSSNVENTEDQNDYLNSSNTSPLEETLDTTFFLSQNEWVERENEAELESKFKQIADERYAQIQLENQRKIRQEWEEKQEKDRKLKEEKERLEQEMREKQEADFNEFLSFLSGDIETPPTKYLMPETISDTENVCYYFSRTATCRFYDGCTKLHPRPSLSTAILIPNFFSHFKLEQSIRDEYDSDLGLEYEDHDLFKEFIDFYEDVVPELRKCGTLIQFKVCCNLEPHLRGNVYIQYQTIREAIETYRKFNGRFYNGKQLSLQFIKMDSWRSAICGSFLRKACVKGRTCNYLHVFRNPTKEFVKADHDWKEIKRDFTKTPTRVPLPAVHISSRCEVQTSSSGANLSQDLHQKQNEGKPKMSGENSHINRASSSKDGVVHTKLTQHLKSKHKIRESERTRSSSKRKKTHKKEKKSKKRKKHSKKKHKKKRCKSLD